MFATGPAGPMPIEMHVSLPQGVMQPDDSSITAVSIAASTAAFSALLVLFIGVPFLLVFETSVQSDAIAVTGVAEPFSTFV
jgi:hypothetical protein